MIIVPVFVTRDGQWLMSRFADGVLGEPSTGTEVCLVPGGARAHDGDPDRWRAA